MLGTFADFIGRRHNWDCALPSASFEKLCFCGALPALPSINKHYVTSLYNPVAMAEPDSNPIISADITTSKRYNRIQDKDSMGG